LKLSPLKYISNNRRKTMSRFLSVLLLVVFITATHAVQVQILLPLGRVAYQTNEQIDLSVVRSNAQALAADTLTMTVSGDDTGKMVFSFPVNAVPLAGTEARTTDHLHLNGWLLRPGNYTVDVAVNGATAQQKIEVYSHLRKSTFRTIDWGCPTNGAAQTILGEDSMGFNLLLASYGGHDQNANIRGGMDYMRNCTQGGAHQMDMRLECDWSDPYVLIGGRARVEREALKDRTSPNVIGVHFYDEPGLTWWNNPRTKEFTGHNVPAQDRAFKSAFDKEALQYNDVKADNPEKVSQWADFVRWKQSFMQAAWKDAAYGVSLIRPDFISATQSVYGWHAFGDGYYFNIARNLGVISGHGGYDDYAGGFLNQAFYQEMGRIRDLQKPTWYLPTWWDMNPLLYRLEQNLAFITNLQGISKPPNAAHDPYKLASADGVVETNKMMARLGTVFTTMPVTRSEVAVLYSMSQNINAQVKNMMNFQDFPGQHERLLELYFASKMAHIPLFPVVEEDLLDGTVATNHKALIITGVESFDPKVQAAVEGYIAAGGIVFLTDDCTVKINGAKMLGAEAPLTVNQVAAKAFANPGEAGRTKGLLARRPGAYFKEAVKLSQALSARCKEIGVKPIYECSSSTVIGSRQAYGDIEYLFAVNATPDETRLEKIEDMNAIKAAQATIVLPNDGRPVYDAVRGGNVTEFGAAREAIVGKFRFGAGEMRAFARTARPIGGVQVGNPILFKDFTVAQNPLHVKVIATLVDTQGKILVGSAPLQVKLIDPQGAVRYDIYRATDQGICAINLPMAANDPAGQWTVEVTELLNNSKGIAKFAYQPAAQCGALSGATQRAVFFGNDRENIYRFFRAHKEITIVKGTSEFNNAAADRLAEVLKPWGVRCTIVTAASVSGPEPVPAEGKKTWVGPGGFNVPGTSILLGNPQDNVLINGIVNIGQWGPVLPYKPDAKTFPGIGRGYLAWQSDVVKQQTESITAIAYDAQGMAEAIGSIYEMASGLDPLTPLALPIKATVEAVKTSKRIPEAGIAWQAALPDRAASIQVEGGKLVALCLDGSQMTIDANGKITGQKTLDTIPTLTKTPVNISTLPKEKLLTSKVPKAVANAKALSAIGYWGGALQVFDTTGTLKTQQMLPQDISCITWLNEKLIVALSDGRIMALTIK
jgi:hypothetical protein